jgi:hypothetical protein
MTFCLVARWSVVALVRVPDTRIAPRPSLLRASPVPGIDRTVQCVWTQPGPIEGLGFEIDARPLSPDLSPDEGWARVSELLPSGIRPDAAGRFEAVIPGCIPGQWQEFRVVPVRHALDPNDPRAINLRRIEGHPSNVMRARADGDILAPQDLLATVSDDGWVVLRWHNQQPHRQIEVRRRAPGRWGFERRSIAGDSEIYRENTPLSEPGTWVYELIAIGSARRAVSKQISIVWPKL